MWERTQTQDGDRGGVRVWAPLIDGTARLGVVRVDLPGAGTGDAAIRAVERVVSLAAELLVAKGHSTDAVELARRHRTMTLAAELQRSNLPPAAVVTPDVAVAAVLQPAYEVAGDSSDYALNADGLHVAILDSVGHDLDSSLVSHVVQGSLRNSRRNGLDLPEAYAVADEALAGLYPDHRFATAAFGRLDHASGVFRWISAGHPAPLVIRGGTVVGEAATVPTVPIGLRHRAHPVVNEVELAPGDALVLYTDGVVEGGVRGGERFGLGRFVDVLDRFVGEGLPPAEVLRRVIVAVLTHTAHELDDDLSIVLVQRRGAAADTTEKVNAGSSASSSNAGNSTSRTTREPAISGVTTKMAPESPDASASSRRCPYHRAGDPSGHATPGPRRPAAPTRAPPRATSHRSADTR